MTELGKLLILLGAVLVILGLIFLLGTKIPGLGRLPGDIVIRKGHFTFYFPLVTCLVISIIITLLLKLFRR